MKFFIDTANIDDLIEFNELGIVDGVTTNPSLIANSGRNYYKVLSEMCEIVAGPVSAEVTAVDSKLMIEEGLALRKISDNIVVKLPCTIEGIKACKFFSNEGIMTNLTLCFSPAQALIAAKAGATFVSPFIGRLDDIAQDGLILIDEIVSIFSNYGTIETEILVASVRNPGHVIESAKMGADIATLPPKLLRQMVEHPLTDKGLEIFLSDWEKSGQKIII